MSADLETTTQKPVTKKKERKPSKKVKDAIELLLSGECIHQKDAAQKVGMAPESLCKALKRPNVKRLIQQRVNQRVSSLGLLTATATLERLARAANSETVQADVSKHIQAIAGVKPTRDGSSQGSGGITLNVVLNGVADTQQTQPIVISAETHSQSGLQQPAHALEGGRGDE